MTENKDFDAYLADLYTKYHDDLVRWCFWKANYRPETEALVEEWIHEAFARAMKIPKKIMSHTNPFEWLKRTCENIMKDYFRHQKKRKKIFGTAVVPNVLTRVEDTESLIEKWVQRYDDQKLLAEILALLSAEEQAVYQRYFVKRMRMAAVAKDLHKTTASVKSMIQRIRKKARDRKNFFAK